MWKTRLILLILWILSLVAISFYGGPISYGFFAITTLVPLSALISLLYVYLFFKVYQRMEDRTLVANHVHPFWFSLQNESFLTFSGVKVNLYSDFSTMSGDIVSDTTEILPRSGIRKEVSIVCHYRGTYAAGVKSIEVQDFLHLFTLRYKNPASLKVVVKPDLVALSEISCLDLQKLSAVTTPVNPTENDILVRKYEAGDDTRRISWKTSARSQELMVRKTIGEEQMGAAVLFSTMRCSKDPKEYLPAENKVLETALALSLFFMDRHIPASLGWYLYRGLSLHRADRPDLFEALYEEISLTQFKNDYYEKNMLKEAVNMPELSRCRSVFLVLQTWCPEALELATILNRNQVSVVFILVSDDPEITALKSELPLTQIIAISPEADLKEVL